MEVCVDKALSRAAGAGNRTVRFTRTVVGWRSSDDEFGILEDERCIDTGVFQERYLLHKSTGVPYEQWLYAKRACCRLLGP